MFLHLITTNTTRDNINKIAISVKKMIDSIELLVTSKVTEEVSGEISCVFDNLREVINPFSSEYKRKKRIKENPFYVEPVAISFGTSTKTVRRKHKSILMEKPLVLYKVPVRKTLEALFKCQNFEKVFFENTLNHHCVQGQYTNVCCGSEFQTHNLRNKTVVMIQLYYDGVNLGDALKQNKNKLKIGAFYFRILNLPPELQSLHMNIHLCGLFNENDIKGLDDGFNKVLKHIVDMFEELENDGLEINIMDEVTRIETAVCSGAFDNLACHQIVGRKKY